MTVYCDTSQNIIQYKGFVNKEKVLNLVPHYPLMPKLCSQNVGVLE